MMVAMGQNRGVARCFIFANPGLSNVRKHHEGTAQGQEKQNAQKGNFPFFLVLLWAVHALCSEKTHMAGPVRPSLCGNLPEPSGGFEDIPNSFWNISGNFFSLLHGET